MKKLIAVFMLIAVMLGMIACNTAQPSGSDTLTISDDTTPVPTVTDDSGDDVPTDIELDLEGLGELATATSTDPNASPSPSPTPESGIDSLSTVQPSKMPKNMQEAAKINEDVYGWIKVPNTDINYPLMYDKDFYYNTHDIYRKKVDTGSIYLYYKIPTRNIIIAGHNMRVSGTMFHELHVLQDNKDKLKTRENRIFEVEVFGRKKWEVFAIYETKDNEPESTQKNNIKHLSEASESEVQTWINTQKSRSEIDLGVSVSPTDNLMTLITCGDNYDYMTAQSRLYFFLKCVD